VLFAFFIFIYTSYFPSPVISEQLESSKIYGIINKSIVQPTISSGYLQKIPLVFNKLVLPVNQDNESQITFEEQDGSGKYLPRKTNSGVRIVWYFNGVTLNDAIKSNEEIDNYARSLVRGETTDIRKAKLIYRWVSNNIKYDYDKVEHFQQNIPDSSTGAIEAFKARKGICFDMSALYVAMLRAVGLKVRLVVGKAYTGIRWGDHSWNEVYIADQKRWVPVDTTFAIGGNYFDRKDFYSDHKLGKIAGEW
jgi:transglutaminase-like putative cysteine protease